VTGRPEPRGTDGPVIEMALLTASGCRFCEHAKDILNRLADDYPLRWHEADITSPTGASIVAEYRVPYPPVLLIDGRFHTYGRVSEKKLRRDLERMLGRS